MQLRPDFLVLYPTDTLYGLGVDATNAEGVAALSSLKGREAGKPVSIVVDSLEMMEQYAEITPLARRLVEAFLPGKLTLILQSKCATPRCRTLAAGVVGKDGSVGIRIPDRPEALALVREMGVPVTATSANVSGMETEKEPEAILKQFGEKASAITRVIDAGELPESAPSTVVDARGDTPVILREGAIGEHAIALYHGV